MLSLTAEAALEGAADDEAAAEVAADSLALALALAEPEAEPVAEAEAELSVPDPAAEDEAAGVEAAPEAPDEATGVSVPEGAEVPAGTVPEAVPEGTGLSVPAGTVVEAGVVSAGVVSGGLAVAVVPGTTGAVVPQAVTVTVTAAGHSSRRMRSLMPCMLPAEAMATRAKAMTILRPNILMVVVVIGIRSVAQSNWD